MRIITLDVVLSQKQVVVIAVEAAVKGWITAK